MRTSCLTLIMLLLVATSVRAKNETPEELKARADAASGGEKAKLCLQYAHIQLEHADELFTQGDIDKAQKQVQEVLEYIHKSADAAMSSGKRLKETEIDLRKMEKRMRELAQSLNVDDRPPVNRGVDEIEQVRASLLARMFGEKAEPKEKS